MIDHLHIKNFLAFPELVVPELKLINLVAGKNNAGKTALLEAISFEATKYKHEILKEIIERRQGVLRYWNAEVKVIGSVDEPDEEVFIINNTIVLESFRGHGYFIYELDGDRNPSKIIGPKRRRNPDKPIKSDVTLILASSEYQELNDLWNSTVLTPLEDEVIAILNTALGLDIKRLSITATEVKVLIGGMGQPVSLETLGEGTKRLLLIALSMVNAKESVILIDEIETHLHHSVIRKLWKIIFEYAVKWNIQVVATTHSQDAIRELFYEAAANEEYQNISQVLRLQIGRSGKHEVIQYPYEELEFMMSTNLEIRGN